MGGKVQVPAVGWTSERASERKRREGVRARVRGDRGGLARRERRWSDETTIITIIAVVIITGASIVRSRARKRVTAG